jgi:hypothetical protein
VPGPDLEVVLSGSFQLHQIDRLVAAIEPIAAIEAPVRLRLDLSGLAFVSPTALTTLVALLNDRLKRGLLAKGSAWARPDNFLVDRYLARMNFHSLFAPQHVEDFKRWPATGFLPCQPILTEGNRDERADELVDVATHALSLDSDAQMQIWFAVRELAQNVLDHAGGGVGGFAMAQSPPAR